ncbi:MAG: LuxR family transcriptional regulator [Candidatus Dormibacteria bacterium]
MLSSVTTGVPPAPRGPATIRTPATPLIGRRRELAALRELLTDPDRRLVTVVGAPGVGKTRLAVATARSCADLFSDGVLEVSLAAVRDPSLVAASLLAAAGGAGTGSADPFEQLTIALDLGRVLLVVDNVEHLASCGDLLARLVERCGELTVLVTSRQPLGVSGERVMGLDPFETPDGAGLDARQLAQLDAVALLADRLGAAGAAVDSSPTGMRLLAGVCRLVDGLPLAIELAAARGRVQPIAAIHAALTRRLPRLEHGPVDAEPRHRSMRDAIAWSVELLDPAAGLAFRHAAVFLGGWTAEGLSAVLPEADPPSLAVTLDALVDRSLVVVEATATGSTRYRMLEVIREFGLEQLSATEHTVARRRHAAHLLRVAQAAATASAGPLLRQSLDSLEAERDNLRAALRWALEAGDTETAESLCLAQRMLWYVRGPLHEGCEAFAAALALPQGDDGRRSRVLSEAAALERQRGALVRAASLSAEATVLARRSGEPLAVAGALLQQGFIAHLRGEFGAARTALEESADLASGLDDVAFARALHHLGIVLHFGSSADVEARPLHDRALAIYRAHGVLRQVATVQVGIAELERSAGNHRAAHRAMREALQLFAELGDLPVLSYALEEAAAIAATEGRYDRALRLLGAADNVEAITGAPTWPVLARSSESWLPQAVASLGATRVARLRRSGGGLNPAQAIEFACGTDDGTAAEHSLSRREREVAALVAAGLTNREVATRLFLSERTVEGHVARILDKLDFRTRTQIATWVSLGGAGGP